MMESVALAIASMIDSVQAPATGRTRWSLVCCADKNPSRTTASVPPKDRAAFAPHETDPPPLRERLARAGWLAGLLLILLVAVAAVAGTVVVLGLTFRTGLDWVGLGWIALA